MRKQLAVLRAAVARDEFTARLLTLGHELWVTEGTDRPATAVACFPESGTLGPLDDAGFVLAMYTVDENVLWDQRIEGPVQSMFAFFRPPAGLMGDAFVDAYRQHADVARVHHPGIRRYAQDIIVEQRGEDRWSFSAISELHFAGPDEYRDRFWLSDESRDVIARDVERFSDPSTAKTVVAPRILS